MTSGGSTMRRTMLNIARFGVAVLLIYWLSRSGAIRWAAVGRLVSAWPLTLAALVMFLVDFAVVSCRICVLVRPRGFHLSIADALRLSVVGHLFTQAFSAAGGDAARIFYATKDAPGRRFEVATLMLLDRVLALMALLFLPIAAIPFYLDLVLSTRALQVLLLVAGAGVVAIAGGLAITLSARARNSAPVRWLLTRVPLGGYPERLIDTVHAFRGNVGALFQSIGLSLVAHLLSCGVIWILVSIVSQQSPPLSVACLAALGFVANNVPLTPGGIGVGEAAFASLFSLAGVSGGAEAMLCWRLMLLTLVAPGLVVYLGGRRQFLRAQAAA